MGKLTPLRKMEEAVHQMVKARKLLSVGDHLVVAVSGGPDSVALAACLAALAGRWKWVVSIGHVNHGLRGQESEADAAFVEELGAHLGLPVSVREVSLDKRQVRFSKQSLQASAREVRYEALASICEERGATKIATGHTADDQAETVVMWMLRGSGTAGLRGIPFQRGERIVRPLLGVARDDIIAYLKERKLTWRVDSSNSQSVYFRNRLRRDLMPQLKGVSPGIVKILARQAEIVSEDHAYLEEVAAQAFQQNIVAQGVGEVTLTRTGLLALPVAIRRRVVRQSFQQIMGHTQGPRFDIVQELLHCLEHGQSGWTLAIKNVQVSQEYDRLIFSQITGAGKPQLDHDQSTEVSVGIPGVVVWPLTGQRMVLSLRNVSESSDQPHQMLLHLDGDTFTPELILRNYKAGDVFCPRGMGGRKKKLQDYFSDIKLPRSQRYTVPLLVAPEGILWVGGLRGDERFRVTPSTASVVVATIED